MNPDTVPEVVCAKLSDKKTSRIINNRVIFICFWVPLQAVFGVSMKIRLLFNE